MTRVTRVALVCAAFFAPAMLAPAAFADYFFQTPSGKIHCLISPSTGGSVRCDGLFWNDRAMTLDHTGKGKRSRISDTVARGSRVLPYGRSVTRDGFTCQSRAVGLRCQSNRSRHGFFISRERWSAF